MNLYDLSAAWVVDVASTKMASISYIVLCYCSYREHTCHVAFDVWIVILTKKERIFSMQSLVSQWNLWIEKVNFAHHMMSLVALANLIRTDWSIVHLRVSKYQRNTSCVKNKFMVIFVSCIVLDYSDYVEGVFPSLLLNWHEVLRLMLDKLTNNGHLSSYFCHLW